MSGDNSGKIGSVVWGLAMVAIGIWQYSDGDSGIVAIGMGVAILAYVAITGKSA